MEIMVWGEYSESTGRRWQVPGKITTTAQTAACPKYGMFVVAVLMCRYSAAPVSSMSTWKKSLGSSCLSLCASQERAAERIGFVKRQLLIWKLLKRCPSEFGLLPTPSDNSGCQGVASEQAWGLEGLAAAGPKWWGWREANDMAPRLRGICDACAVWSPGIVR